MMTRPRSYFRIAIVFGVAVPCLLWSAAIGAAQNTDRPQPTYADVAYGPHERNVVDFYKVDSDKPTALLVYFHGGGWRNGSKKDLKHKLCRPVMESGIAFAAANYRLTGHAPHPAQLHDAARAIQFLRSKATEWNIDPNRIAAYGGSAGGSISMWLALHDDMADPASDDPIARQSTRLSCAIGINGQSTNDPRIIRKIIPGKAYNQSALKTLFGLPDDWDWDTAEVSDELSARLIDGSPITHLTKDDPPVFVYHTEQSEVPGNIHHPDFGRYLKKKMDAMNIECLFSMSLDYVRGLEDRNADFLVFLRKHLEMNDAKQLKRADRIKPYAKNSRYWQYEGKPVMLLGGNKWDAPFFVQAQKPVYDNLQAVGGNYLRYILKQRQDDSGEVIKLVRIFPFRKLSNGKYDLNQWSDDYWNRFSNGLRMCEDRDIIAQITLWDHFDFYKDEWDISPWNPENNVNYTRSESGLAMSYPVHPGKDTNPFMKTVPTMQDNTVVLDFQKKLIGKMISITLSHNNVLYNMANEGNPGQERWDQWWCDFIKSEASAVGQTIYTTTMFDKQDWGPVVNNPSVYTYVEGSKVGSRWTERGQTQYDVAVGLIDGANAKLVRPVNAVKVRTQKIEKHAQERLWRPLMAGFAALSHHRTGVDGALCKDGPGSFGDNHASNTYLNGGLGLERDAKNNIKAMRAFTDVVVPWETSPRQDLLTNRANDEAYLRAKVGEVYGLYFVDTGSVGLKLGGVSGTFRLRWIDIARGGYTGAEQTLTAGSTVTITTPGSTRGGWAAVITKVAGLRIPAPLNK